MSTIDRLESTGQATSAYSSDSLYDTKSSRALDGRAIFAGPTMDGCSLSSKATSVLNVNRVPSRMTFGQSLFPMDG